MTQEIIRVSSKFGNSTAEDAHRRIFAARFGYAKVDTVTLEFLQELRSCLMEFGAAVEQEIDVQTIRENTERIAAENGLVKTGETASLHVGLNGMRNFAACRGCKAEFEGGNQCATCREGL